MSDNVRVERCRGDSSPARIYTTCYAISYGVVFPTVLIAKSIPTDNAVVNGFVDGARAASDMVEQLKSRQIVSAAPERSLIGGYSTCQ